MPTWHAIGIMSGTSADGADCVLMRLSHGDVQLLAHHATPYPPDLREAVLRLNAPQPGEIDHMGHCARRLGAFYAAAAGDLLAREPAAVQVDLIACHGQTIRHQPHGEEGFTLQIGWADAVAESTGITTIADFRPRDVVAGGQGAPLVPAFHQALFAGRDARLVLNLGGMANLTWLPPKGSGQPVIAFDTGPGNVLMDALAHHLSGQPCDLMGAMAKKGRPRRDRVAEWLKQPYFQEAPPKSTGRELFGEAFLQTIWSAWQGSGEDCMASLNLLTAESVALAIRHWTDGAPDLLVFGGGAENPVLMQNLQDCLPGMRVRQGEAASGIPSQALEAMAFAWLGIQSIQGKAGNLPSVTGARRAVPLGAIHPGNNWHRLLEKVLRTP